MEPRISIIIPVYDVSCYLRKCLESAVNQTLRDIEIIIINDSSPDPDDDVICSEFAERDKRVTYIRYEVNRRQGGARNTGLDIAKGDYIWFVDSDDFIDTNACEFLYRLAIKTNADIVAFSATSHVKGDLNLSNKSYYNYYRDAHILDRLMPGYDFLEQSSIFDSFHVSPCIHIFKKSLFTRYRFREHVFYEDTDLIPIIIYQANSIFCSKYAPYYRLLREGSVTQNGNTELVMLDKHAAINSLLKFISDHDLAPTDPLCKFARRQFRAAQASLAGSISEISTANNAFDKLARKYPATLGFQDETAKSFDIGQLQKSNNTMRLELERIKQSRLWRLGTIIQQVKRFLGL
ncbi:MAG: glycosyltransferase family 2 protein [Alcanivoracaceae bacterium]|nr:glycosyltransferase family 2 protein [Alcanivoracaceae bacterium]